MREYFSRSAFSLIEVTIAMGLVAFAALVIFAMLPTALSLSRESSDETIAVNVLSAITMDINNSSGRAPTSFLQGVPLTVANSGTNYFDEQGVRVMDAADPQARYRATWEVRLKDAFKTSSRHVYLRVGWPAAKPVPNGWVETVVVLPENVFTN